MRDTAIVLSLCAFFDKEARQGRPGAARLGQRLAAPRRAGDKPDDAVLFDLLLDWAPNEAVRHRILVENPTVLYDYPKSA